VSDFSETWKAMSVEQRARHIIRDWQDSRESSDPMVLRVAAVVAHAVLQELVTKTDELRAERDEARQMWCHAMWLIGGKRPDEQAKAKGWDCFKENTDD
jgi:hypothetical protein